MLLDRATYGQDDAALADLWTALGRPGPPRREAGPLRAAVRARLSGRPGAELLDATARLAAGDGPREAAVALRRAARAGPMTDHARLRLAIYCLDSLITAASAPWSDKHATVNRCLFALYDADPAPYFDPDPRLRPPDPPWTALRDAALALLLGLDGGPLAPVAARVRERAGEALRAAAPGLPAPILPAAFGLPAVPEGAPALPYDREPLLIVLPSGVQVDGAAFPEGGEPDAQRALREALGEHRGGRVAIAAPADTPWRRVLAAADLARRAGALVAGLAGAEPLAAAVPPSDFLATVPGPPARLALVRITLYTLEPFAPRPSLPRDFPRGALYDPALAPGGLTLHVSADGVALRGAGGEVAAGTTADLAVARGRLPDRAILARADAELPCGRAFDAIALAATAFPRIGLSP